MPANPIYSLHATYVYMFYFTFHVRVVINTHTHTNVSLFLLAFVVATIFSRNRYRSGVFSLFENVITLSTIFLRKPAKRVGRAKIKGREK